MYGSQCFHSRFGGLPTDICVEGCSGFGSASQHNLDQVEGLPPSIRVCHETHSAKLPLMVCQLTYSSFRTRAWPTTISQ